MKLNKMFLFLIVFFLLFQDSIVTQFGILFIDYIDEIFVIISFFIAIFNILKNKRINFPSLKILLLLIIFSIVGGISCINNSNYTISRLIVSNFLAIKFWLLLFSVSNFNMSIELKENIIEIILKIEKVVMFFALINLFFPNQYYRIFDFPKISYRFGISSVCSLFNHQGKYGWFMLFCAIIYISKYNCEKEKKDLKSIFIAILFALLSMRTKVIIASIIIAIVYFMILKVELIKEKIKKILPFLIISVGFVFIFRSIIYNTYILYFTDTNGVSARQALMNNSFKIANDYFPLGVGFGKYGSWYARKYYSEYYYIYGMDNIYGLTPSAPTFGTDTFWPVIIGETGFIGLGIYILMIIYLLKKLIYIYKFDGKSKLSIFLTLGSILALLQTIIESTGEPSFNSGPQNIFVSVFIGLALQQYAKEKRNEI